MIDHVDTSFELLPTLSICTGIRGLERGIERVVGPIRTLAYVEIEAFIIENLLAGMEAGLVAPAPIWANLKTFPWEQFRGKVGILMGGYPCQPFSTAGQRKGDADPRHLWPHIEFGIRTTRPVCCFFENVSGHLTLGFEQVADSLRAMGYAVESGIYTAAEVGAPHKRARLFILGILADSKDNVRGLYERSWRCEETEIDIGRPGEMADTSGGIGSGPRSGEGRQSGFGSCEMAHPYSFRPGADATDPLRQGGQAEGEEQWQERNEILGQRDGTDVGNVRPAMADGIGQGLEERREQSARDERQALERGRDVGRWPAPPGQRQYEWECPHTIESGMGCTVDGYNFREDLLRALGNGVVEQTAELAFRTLLKKHFA